MLQLYYLLRMCKSFTISQKGDHQMSKCPFCNNAVNTDATFCSTCGKQIQSFYSSQPPNTPPITRKPPISTPPVTPKVPVYTPPTKNQKSKWVSFFLCLFTMCGHKFYEGKYAMGFIYLCTAGLFGIGWFIDLIVLLFKPNPYYV